MTFKPYTIQGYFDSDPQIHFCLTNVLISYWPFRRSYNHDVLPPSVKSLLIRVIKCITWCYLTLQNLFLSEPCWLLITYTGKICFPPYKWRTPFSSQFLWKNMITWICWLNMMMLVTDIPYISLLMTMRCCNTVDTYSTYHCLSVLMTIFALWTRLLLKNLILSCLITGWLTPLKLP